MSCVNTAYQEYRKWCERLSIPPAAFETWKRTTDRVSEIYDGPWHLGCGA